MTDELHIPRQLEELLRPIVRAAQSAYAKEQQADIVGDLIKTLTNRALEANLRAGTAEGYHKRLQEELERQLAVQAAMVARVAWYENITRIVVGGQVSADAYDNGPHATGIRCERCHRQVEEREIVKHLINHAEEDAKELEIRHRAAEIRRAAAMKEEAAMDDERPKRHTRKKTAAK